MLHYLARLFGRCEICGREATRRLNAQQGGKKNIQQRYYCESCLADGIKQADSGEFLATGKKFTVFHSIEEIENAGIQSKNIPAHQS